MCLTKPKCSLLLVLRAVLSNDDVWTFAALLGAAYVLLFHGDALVRVLLWVIN